MKISIKKLPKCQLELEIELPTEEFDGFINQAILNLGKDLEVKGFRKGKIPKEIIEEKVGKANILNTAAKAAIEENYKKAIFDNKLEPISQPEITILKIAPGNPFVFRAKTTILSEINLPDYKKIAPQIKKREIFVTEKEIEDSLNFLQKSRAKFTALLRPAKEGDFVEIEYESQGFKKIKDAFVLGKGKLVPGFEEKLIGMEGGQEKEFSLIFPKDSFRKDLAGKKVDFKVKMISVQKIELPEINEEFAQNLGKFANLAEFKKSLRIGLKIEKEIEERQRRRKEILGKIADNSKFEIPDLLVELEKDQMFQDLKQKINQNLKISFENYLAATKQSETNLKNTFLKEAERRVKNFLILREIGKREKISVLEEEIKEELNKVIKNYSPKDLEKLKFDLPQLKEYTKGVIYNEKVFQKLESFLEKN